MEDPDANLGIPADGQAHARWGQLRYVSVCSTSTS